MFQGADSQHRVWIDIFAHGDQRVVAEIALVLEARAIPHVIQRDGNDFKLAVPDSYLDAALREVTDYRNENFAYRGGSRSLAYVGTGWPGVLAYVSFVLFVAVALRQDLFGYDWLGIGEADSNEIAAGQWWRAITALGLHVDGVHLFGNIVFGSFFGYFTGRHLGDGLAWLAIVLSGAAGNLLNALVQGGDHRSIGASTAVFASLGILAAYTWRRGFYRETPWRTRFAPVTASIALLAFTGTGGENTDIGAHLFGFIAGFVSGACISAYRIPTDGRYQRQLGVLTGLLVAVAWVVAATLG